MNEAETRARERAVYLWEARLRRGQRNGFLLGLLIGATIALIAVVLLR